MKYAPVVLFVYRRIHHTQRVLESLLCNAEVDATELFIYSDGPKSAQDAPAVEGVRELCRAFSGFGRVTLIERPTNWGLARSVIAGVSEVCESHGRVIVLEDDLVVSRYFLDYMNDALNRYESEERVMQISAHMFPVPPAGKSDAAFLPMTTSWGWATWQRAWKIFDPHMRGFNQLAADPRMRKAFDLDGSYPYFRMLQAQRDGGVDSWAIRWWLTVFIEGATSLFPAQSLVQNIGFDGSGTHCGTAEGPEFRIGDFRVLVYPDFEIDLIQFGRVKSFLASQNRPIGVLSKLRRLIG